MSRAYHLFEVFGVELEYMLVDRDHLDVLPLTDEVLKAVAGDYVAEVERDSLAWSNELVLHVIELKTNGPAPGLDGLAPLFQASAQEIERILEPLGGRLMPGGMHPWMDPWRETRLWPHEYSAVYSTLDRIFDCRGHGWSNLQSLHMNLPFAGDEEFGRLHSAIRLVMPLMPALAAASPVMDGRLTGLADNRLAVYRDNQKRIPSITGRVIPEPLFTEEEYREKILAPMYADIEPWDPDGVLRYEWLNSRGAIARFERNTIEVRVLDVQECPQADMAVYGLIVEVLRALAEERLPGGERTRWAFPVERLVPVLDSSIRQGGAAWIEDGEYLSLFDLDPGRPLTANAVWRELLERLGPRMATDQARTAERLLAQGTLAERLQRALGPAPGRDGLLRQYRRLADCLAQGTLFDA